MEYYGGIRWSSEILDCSMPIVIDTYSRCSYGCLYCFANFNAKHVNAKVKYFNVEKLKKLFYNEIYDEKFSPFIKKRLYIQWGGMSDPFDEFEKKFGKTKELLTYLKKINYPLSFSTKGTFWTQDDEYCKLFYNQKNWYVKISIINLDEELAKKVEVGVPSPQERLNAIKRLSKLKIGGIVLRLRPFIIGLSDRNNEYLDLIKQAKSYGADAISTEFLCITQYRSKLVKNKFNLLSKTLGYDIINYYRKKSFVRTFLRLNRFSKLPYIEKMYDLCKKIGMRFYVSDAHLKDYNDNGSCCGLKKTENYFKCQFTELVCKAREKKSVSFNDLEIFPEYKNMLIKNMINCLSNRNYASIYNQSVYGYFKEYFNNIDKEKSLYEYTARVLKPVQKDKDGNIIYKYAGKDFNDKNNEKNKKKVEENKQ